jgi:glycosyltransferase involved in cell wall biosynthesis
VTREAERTERGIPPDAFVYGFIGNLLPYKGLEELIDAFSAVDDGTNWLLISGGAPREYGDSIVAHAAGHPRVTVRTYDYAPGEAFVRVLQASDVIVLPFRASTTSGSLVQALSWPRPCVVPRMGCLPTQMDEDAGILYPPEGADALEEALRQARGLDLEAARVAAWRSAVRADWDDIARRTIEAYKA